MWNLNDDKVIEKIINELKGNKRKNWSKDIVAPKFIFLCGKQILNGNNKVEYEEDGKNIRFYIMKELQKKLNKCRYDDSRYKYISILSEKLYSFKTRNDILTFEELLATISDCIILIVESPGTFCELGAFIMDNRFLKNTIVVNEYKEEYKNSFITLGPIEKVKYEDSNKLVMHYGYENIIQNDDFITSILDAMSTIKAKMPFNKSKNLKLKSLINELANLIEIFEPITKTELMGIYKKIYNIEHYEIVDSRKFNIKNIGDTLELMIKMNIVRNQKGYYSLNKDYSFYNYSFNITDVKFNQLRAEYLSRIYKYNTVRMENYYEFNG